MANPTFVQAVLDAYIGLFTQPFDQDLKASKRVAGAAITLPLLPGLTLANDGEPYGVRNRRLQLGVGSRLGRGFPAIFGKPERKKLAIARNLRVVSFWIAVTLVFVISVEFVFSNPLDRAIRLLAVLGALVAFVPVHMCRNFRNGLALLIPALWLSMGLLAWRVIY